MTLKKNHSEMEFGFRQNIIYIIHIYIKTFLDFSIYAAGCVEGKKQMILEY